MCPVSERGVAPRSTSNTRMGTRTSEWGHGVDPEVDPVGDTKGTRSVPVVAPLYMSIVRRMPKSAQTDAKKCTKNVHF